MTTVNSFNLTLIDKFVYILKSCIEKIEINVATILEFLSNSLNMNSEINIYEERANQSAINKIDTETKMFLKEIKEILVEIEQKRKERIKSRKDKDYKYV